VEVAAEGLDGHEEMHEELHPPNPVYIFKVKLCDFLMLVTLLSGNKYQKDTRKDLGSTVVVPI
jgi:hypothetical protein